MSRKSNPILLFLLAMLLALGCRTIIGQAEPTASPTPSPAVEVAEDAAPISPTATPFPTADALASTPTKAPPAAAAPPTPQVELTDLSPHYRAMRPAFAADVDAVANAGASRYFIGIDFTLADDAPRINGVERIIYTNTEPEPLSDIYFRLYPNMPGYGGAMEVSAAVVNGLPVTPNQTAENTALHLPLAASLPPGAAIDLTLFFEVTLPTRAGVGYNIFSYLDYTAALATFYPAVAVFDDFGWDTTIPPPYGDATYLDTSLYLVEATVPAEMVVAASGSQLSAMANADGTQTVRLASGPMRDFYIAMRPDYQRLSDEVDGIAVNSYFPPGAESGGQMALQYAVDSLRVFNEKFGPYPYAEFDVAATPTTAGGVEYPGIVVAATALYGREDPFFQHVIGHEVAHQWWYGVVGNHQVKEPWLDESLTNYSTVIYWEALEGQSRANYIIDTLFAGPYERSKNQGDDRPVLGAVDTFSEGQYVTFVYSKGALFFHALRQQVGDDIYFEIMQKYYTRFKYKHASTDDLLSTIEAVSGQNTRPLVEMWLDTP